MRANGAEQDGVSVDGVVVIRATEKAILCRVPDGNGMRELWIPQSCVTADSECWQEGDEGTLVVKGWFARKEDLT